MNKNIITAGYFLLMTLAVSVLSGACQREAFDVKDKEIIRFSPAEGEKGAMTSKAGESPYSCLTLTDANSTDTLYLHGTSSEWEDPAYTRATPIPFADMNSFVVTSYVRGIADESLSDMYFRNVVVSKGESGWESSGDYYWPGEDFALRFFAYAPADITGVASLEFPSTMLEYTVPEDFEEQKDLMIAVSDGELEDGYMRGNHYSDVPLMFRHLCTGIMFTQGNIGGKILEISIKGVHNHGTYRMDGPPTTTNWVTDGSGTFTFTRAAYEAENTIGAPVTFHDYSAYPATERTVYFMMLPQVCPEGATIEVRYQNNSGTSVTISASLAGEEWKKGRIVNYRISDKNIEPVPVFELEKDWLFFTSDGAEKTFSVKSYLDVGGTKVTKGWTVEFVEDDGEGGYNVVAAPEWISMPSSGAGSTEGEQCTINVSEQTEKIGNPHVDYFNDVTPVSGTYNLSSFTGSMEEIENTANCYIINAPGTYAIPLVYGNAIENGRDNEKSYAPWPDEYGDMPEGTNEKYLLKRFLNHAYYETPGEYYYSEPIRHLIGIVSPFIEKNDKDAENLISVDDAVLIWQDDEEGMITVNGSFITKNIEYLDAEGNPATENVRFLTFNVDAGKIKQGNAVIAVRDDETIVWSWHIWVTDYEPLAALKTDEEIQAETEFAQEYRLFDHTKPHKDIRVYSHDNNYNYTYMAVPVGWVDNTEYYADREAKIRLKQDDSDATIIMEVSQLGNIVRKYYAAFYEGCRKDPFLPTGKATYYFENSYSKQVVTSPSDMELYYGILNPNIVYDYDGYWDWYTKAGMIDKHYNNLWYTKDWHGGSGISEAKTELDKKTIYDPSPVGYMLPPSMAFAGFSYNGIEVGNYSGDRNQWTKYNSPYISTTDVLNNHGYIFYCKGMNGEEGAHDGSKGVIYFPALGYEYANGTAYFYGTGLQYWGAQSSTNGAHATFTIMANIYEDPTKTSEILYFQTKGTERTDELRPIRPVRDLGY